MSPAKTQSATAFLKAFLCAFAPLREKVFLFVVEENVCDCVGDGQTGKLFEPEEFAARIQFEKDVAVVRRKNDVDCAVVQ
jgi:hypothetical protein